MCEPSCFYKQKPARRGRTLAALMTVSCLLGVAARAEEGSSKVRVSHATARSAPPASKAVRGSSVTQIGFVGDGNAHGWPLYASVAITGDSFSTTVYTNPATGMYTVELFEGVEYEFTAHAILGGYIDEVRTVTPAAEPENQDFSLALDTAVCTALGYGQPLDEQFNSENTPAGWEVIDNAGYGVEWAFDDPGGRGNLTPGGTGGFATADSDAGGFYPVDTELVSPVINLAGLGGLKLRFETDLLIYPYYSAEIADVDVSVNGGATWANAFRRTEAQGSFNASVSVPLPMLDGQPQARIRFHYYDAYFDYWWQVDNVKIGVAVDPPTPDYAESFDSPTFPPPDWTILDVDGGATTWVRTTTTPHSGAGAAWFDDGASTDPPQEGWLVSPEINISDSGRFLQFFEKDNFPTFYESHTLWICTASCGSPPTNFTQILEMADPVTSYRPQTVNLDPYVGETVRFAWRYTGTFADEWFVDDVTVSVPSGGEFECGAKQGGLLVGTVFDANTNGGLDGATVSAGNSSTTTVATPDDDALPDGFYSLFVETPASRGGFPTEATATKPGFTTDTRDVVVVFDSAIGQSFTLDAPKLNLTPAEVTVVLGEGVHTVITASNSGPSPLEFRLKEAGFTIEGGRPAAAPTVKHPAPTKSTPPAIQPRKRLPSLHDNRVALKQKASERGHRPVRPKAPNRVVPPRASDIRADETVLSVDDGTLDNDIGLNGGGQFLWLNRFTPTDEQLPFTMNAVDILFDADFGVDPGDLVDIYVWEDTDGDGDPGTNAVLRSQINGAEVQFADGVTFSTFPLPETQEFTEGDVLVGVVNRTAGVGANEFPAAIDQTAPQGRSWLGIYSADPGDPPELPADDTFDTIDNLGLPGNWMVRAHGTSPEQEIVWLTVSPPDGTLDEEGGANDHMDINLGFDSFFVDQPGTYIGSLRVLTDTPYDEPPFPVVMNVVEPVLSVDLSAGGTAHSGDPGTAVAYSMTVTNNGNTTDSYDIALAQDATPWTTVAPASVGPLGPGETQDITVYVLIPANAASAANDAVMVFASSRRDPGVSASQFLTTTANRVVRMSVTPGVSVQSTPGGDITFTLRVTNTGNATDSYNVTKAVSGQPFVTTAPSTVTSVAPNTSKDFTVTVAVPSSALGGASSTAQITLRSQTTNSVSAVATLLTLVDATSGAMLSPTSVVKDGDEGEDVVFTLTVKNVGNVSDAFDLSVTGSTWPTQLDVTSTAALAPGGSQNAHLTVTVPLHVEAGDLSAAIVTATSQSNHSVKASAAMVARYNEGLHEVGAMSLAGAALLVLILGAVAGVTRRRRSRVPTFN